MSSKTIQGLTAIPFQISPDCTSCHEIYVKEHSFLCVEEDKPLGRTLVVLNIPPYISKAVLKHSFAVSGIVKDVIFEQQYGFKTAFVIFDKRESLIKSLKLKCLKVETSSFNLKTGVEQWINNYNKSISDRSQLELEIKTFMDNYETNEKLNSSKDAVDDEGWTVVTKKGRNPGVSRKESVGTKLQEKSMKLQKKKQLKNFYTFQINESKMKDLVVLRKNFEEAKKRVNLMKNARRFKPY